MERSTLYKAIAVAGLTAAVTFPSSANETAKSDFEFHGYLRAGAFSSVNNDLGQAMYFGQKETLGRLGLESDDFYELAFVQRWDWEESGDSIRINARLGQNNPRTGAVGQGLLTIDGVDTGLLEGFVEIDGITETGTMWAGQRYYGRDNYIFMTDFFYTDWSGTGIGVQNLKLGGAEWDFGYLASNRSAEEDYAPWNGNPIDEETTAGAINYTMLHTLHARADFNQWRVEALAKYLPKNPLGDDFSTAGIEAHISYTPNGSFFGLGDGFSTASLQLGQGLGSGTMLGRSFTNYNAFSPGGAGSQTFMTSVKDGDFSARAQAYGGIFFGDLMFFPAIGFETTSYEDSHPDPAITEDSASYWYAMVRPVYTMPSIDNFALASEFGITDQSLNDGDVQYKATIAPTWSMGTGFGPAPELRLMASYVSNNAGDSDIIVGAQVDVWW